jgi:hypothetical protein
MTLTVCKKLFLILYRKFQTELVKPVFPYTHFKSYKSWITTTTTLLSSPFGGRGCKYRI